MILDGPPNPLQRPLKALEGWIFFDGSQIPFTKGPLERVVFDVPKTTTHLPPPRSPRLMLIPALEDSLQRRSSQSKGLGRVDSGPATLNLSDLQNHLSHISRTHVFEAFQGFQC